MYVEALKMTDEGVQATKDAEQGGVYIRPVSFVLGDYVGSAPSSTPSALLGNEVYRGNLDFIEVLGKNSVRFTFSMPQNAPAGVSVCTIGEAIIYLDDGKTLGYAQFKEPQLKTISYGLRFSLIVHTEVNIGQVIDVTMAEHTSIPCVPSVENLPLPATSILNVVSVLGMSANSDGTISPGLAYRYGSGGLNWGFSEHDRVFCEALGSRMVSITQFDFTDKGFVTGENFIVQAVSGPGAGTVRRYVCDGGMLICTGDPMPFVDATTFFAVWRRVMNDTMILSGLPWPDSSDKVPEDWILARGTDKPTWVPPSAVVNYGSKTSVQYANSLYTPPGKLSIKSLVTTAKSGVLRYALPAYPVDPGHVLLSLQGVTQIHTAFDVVDSEAILTESVPESMTLDLRVFNLEPTTGHVVSVVPLTFLSDGSTSEFALPDGVTSPEQVLAVLQRVLNPITAFTIADGKLRLTEVPDAGTYITFYLFIPAERQGWSSRVSLLQTRTRTPTTEFVLHTSPETIGHVLFNESGLLLHPDMMELNGNILRVKTAIPEDRDIEITVIENLPSNGSAETNISGVMTHAYLDGSGLVFERHGLNPLRVPLLPPHIRAEDGLSIEGTWPDLVLRYPASNESSRKIAAYSLHNRVEDTEEIVVVQRIDIQYDCVVDVSSEFAASLGPGFSPSGREIMEYVVALRTVGKSEPDFGRKVKGSDSAGFNVSTNVTTEYIGYSNASISQVYNLIKANHSAGYVEVVCKMRVSNANVKAYGSNLSACVNIKVTPN
jgi:hypothetical protein